MVAVTKTAVSAVVFAMAALGNAHAGVVDLGLHGANVFAFKDFKAPSADVEGSIMAGRDVQLGSYSVNEKNVDAYGRYSLIVGRDLSFSSGSINNGYTFVGRNSDVKQSVSGFVKDSSGKSPVDMTALSKQLKTTSGDLTKLNSTGSAQVQWSGLNITGTKKSVEVFNLDAKTLASVNNFSFNNLSAGSTLIFNISGSKVAFNGGYQGFENYNVLFNFYQATSIDFNTGLTANILAPLAAVNGGSGAINGNVVVDSWSSSVQINADHFFKPTNVAGFLSPVPEPSSYAMLLAGFGLIGFMARRRQQAR